MVLSFNLELMKRKRNNAGSLIQTPRRRKQKSRKPCSRGFLFNTCYVTVSLYKKET